MCLFFLNGYLDEGKIPKTRQFNPAVEFTDKELVSMLFYLGYLTIAGEEFGIPELKIPNRVMKEIYSSYKKNKKKRESK